MRQKLTEAIDALVVRNIENLFDAMRVAEDQDGAQAEFALKVAAIAARRAAAIATIESIFPN